jgi:hypothetical protein
MFRCMAKRKYLMLIAVAAAIVAAGCKGEKKASTEPETFQFTIYPGSRYLQQVTELYKQASKAYHPNEEVPPMAVYDTDAPIDQVAEYYAKAYGYNTVAPDATNNLSSAKPPAYYHTGDLGADVKGADDMIKKLNLKVDTSKAVGTYRAAEISRKPNRPQVSLQRPYFDFTTSQVVDRTVILMTR